ncbi:MAG: ATP-binding cassette domain-containing protein [Alphaproteobacteria bacterium]
MKPRNILQIKSLEYEVDNQKIIKGNSFNINYKEHQLILGNSGSGKTTLLNLMSGLLKPSGGEILFEGVKYSTLNEKDLDSLRAENFGFIFQKLNLIDYLSVKQNIALVNDNLNSFNINKIIGELGLAEKSNQRVKNLSFGEAQRVAIARGVINNPKVIFADEPTSALDDTNTEIVMKMIFDYADKNDSTLVVCTHDDRVKSFFSNPMVIK